MKVCLCCIGKMENQYIREYVEYYKDMGFDKIYLYDNNDTNGERFEEVIDDYIKNDFVDVTDYRGKKVCQREAYDDCFSKHHDEYDWIAFFDCDEFITFTEDKTIQEYLSREIFASYGIIHLNWMIYGDNDLSGLESDDRSVLRRFTKPLPYDTKGFDFFYTEAENNHVKSIVRGTSKISWEKSWNPHTPRTDEKCCTNIGKSCNPNSPFEAYNFQLCYLRHFITKTIAEWKEKIKRGYCDQTDDLSKKHITYERFFKVNKINMDKIKVINETSNN